MHTIAGVMARCCCLTLFVAVVASAARPSAVVLLGPSGAGKSETGNTLTGLISFNVSDGLESETKQPGAARVASAGREWQVVDTPGYFDTTLTPQQQDDLLGQFARLVDGPIAALVFVVPYGRFGDAHLRAWRLALGAFGPTAINHTLLAFTSCGEKSSQEVAESVAKLCNKTLAPLFCEAVGSVPATRIVAFGKLEPPRRRADRQHFFDVVVQELGQKEYHLGDFLKTRERQRLLAKRVANLSTDMEQRPLLEELLRAAESGTRSYDDVARALRELGEAPTVFCHVDFEDRSLGPFRLVGEPSELSWRNPIAVPYRSMHVPDTCHAGRLLLHTASDSGVKLRKGDERKGEFRSKPFLLGHGEVSWRATGSGGLFAICPADQVSDAAVKLPLPEGCVVRHVRREDRCLADDWFREEELWSLQGQSVVLQIVDSSPKGWGFVALDDLRYPVLQTGPEEPC